MVAAAPLLPSAEGLSVPKLAAKLRSWQLSAAGSWCCRCCCTVYRDVLVWHLSRSYRVLLLLLQLRLRLLLLWTIVLHRQHNRQLVFGVYRSWRFNVWLARDFHVQKHSTFKHAWGLLASMHPFAVCQQHLSRQLVHWVPALPCSAHAVLMTQG